MKFRGISPLVATIMLIAFTLIIAGLISTFVINFTETQQSQIKSCVEAKIMLQRAIYDPASKNLTLTIYNYGRVDLRFESLLTYSNTTLHPGGLEKPNKTIDVSAGKIVVFNVESVANDLDTITIKSTRCDTPCVECPGAQDFIRYTDIRGLGYT